MKPQQVLITLMLLVVPLVATATSATHLRSHGSPNLTWIDVPTPRATPGLVAAIDPETGRLSAPTHEQLDALAARAADRAGAASRPAPVLHVSGAVSMDVRGWMREYSVVRLGAQKRPVLACANDRASAVSIAGEARSTSEER